MSRYWGTYDPLPDTQCSDCEYPAVDQDAYDAKLCEWHLREAFAIDAADDAVKNAKENPR